MVFAEQKRQEPVLRNFQNKNVVNVRKRWKHEGENKDGSTLVLLVTYMLPGTYMLSVICI